MTRKLVNRIDFEILSLTELLLLLWRARLFILLSGIITASVSVNHALSIPNLYESTSILTPSSQIKQPASSLLADIGAGSLGGGANNESTLAFLSIRSRTFFDVHIYPHVQIGLMAGIGWNAKTGELILDDDIYDASSKTWTRSASPPFEREPNPEEVFEVYLQAVNTNVDMESGFYELKVRHVSPYFCQSLSELIIEELGAFMQNRSKETSDAILDNLAREDSSTQLMEVRIKLFDMVEMQKLSQVLSNLHQQHLFYMIQEPSLSFFRVYPNRAMICITWTLFGLVIACISCLIIRLNFNFGSNNKFSTIANIFFDR